MSVAHNDIDVSNFETNNVNDNEGRGVRKILNVNRIATDLVKMFGSQTNANPKDDKSWEFYCLVAGTLPENIVRSNAETAILKAKSNKGGYFNRLCKVSIYELKKSGL